MREENHSNGIAAPQQPIGLAEVPSEETHALRWRSAILRLSEAFMDAADERRDLSPILLEALHNALDNLLVYGEADDLMVLEEWLSMEEGSKSAAWRRERRALDRRDHDRRFSDRRFTDRRQGVAAAAAAAENRTQEDRRRARRREPRATADRRQESRRAPRDWQFEDIKVFDPSQL